MWRRKAVSACMRAEVGRWVMWQKTERVGGQTEKKKRMGGTWKNKGDNGEEEDKEVRKDKKKMCKLEENIKDKGRCGME